LTETSTDTAGASREDEPIAAIVLAAGTSSRMGSPKQLLPYRGQPLLQHVIDLLPGLGLADAVVVLGHQAREIASAIDLPPGVRAIVNSDYASGQRSSLRAGLAALAPGTAAALVLLGDQPRIPPEALRTVLHLRRTGAPPVIRASYQGKPGHPVLLDRSIWSTVSPGTDDAGARAWMADHPHEVLIAPLALSLPIEVDSEDDYRRLLNEP